MLPARNVELTKVHYFEASKHHRNAEVVPTISEEVFQNTFNRNLIIKKNIFGHKWVLRVNELDGGNIKKKKSVKCLLYCVVFSCIILAILSGIFFTFELEKRFLDSSFIEGNQSFIKIARSIDKIFNNKLHLDNDGLSSFKVTDLSLKKGNVTLQTTTNGTLTTANATGRLYCANCTENHVCFKTEETEKPKCVEIVDKHDPTGCGGLCIVNVEYCAILDRQHMVYQCTPLANLLRCPSNTFNCGEQCIARSKVCDGIVHCKDMQDERFCDCRLEDNFQCTNSTKCLPKNKRCDGIVDCWDRSDEKNCHKGCPSGQYSCIDGQCIPKDHFCDGVIHCSDSSDEPQGCLV